MNTLGIDFAAGHKKTVVARVAWSARRAKLVGLHLQATNKVIADLIEDRTVAKAGIDCPLGWPLAFVELLDAHQKRLVPQGQGETVGDRKSLAYRRTDQIVGAGDGVWPLSVSADRIGHAAMRLAGLLSELDHRGVPVDRTGKGTVVEVYPAAALKYWGFQFKSYKTTGLRVAATQFFDRCEPWFEVSEDDKATCQSNDDAFDAVVAAFIARAATRLDGVTRPHAVEDWQAAVLEGWIAVPRIPLETLPTAKPHKDKTYPRGTSWVSKIGPE